MKHLFILICPLLIFSIFFSSCTFDNSKKNLEEIGTYLSKNEFNNCLLYVKKLDDDKKASINNEVCEKIIDKFVDLKSKVKVNNTNIFDLSLIDTSFAEDCQKLWNIISEFAIDKEWKNYNEAVNLRYYSEMIDYTRYCDIYSLAKKANDSGYLNDLSIALNEYNKNGDNAKLKLLIESIKKVNFNSFDPQQYLVSDYKDAHEKIVNALNELDSGFATNDSIAVANGIHSLKSALNDILYIFDTLTVVNTLQKSIYNKVSTENIYAHFDNSVNVTRRDFASGMSFALDSVFGGIDNNESDNESNESSTENIDAKISKDEAIKIAVNAINKTKRFTGTVNITLTQTRNIELTAFESASSLADTENMVKSQLNQIINQSNGTGRKNVQFMNGKNENQSLNSFIPPSDKDASLNPKSVIDYTCVKGSGGYIITFTLDRELVTSDAPSDIIGNIVNPFEFEKSDDVKKYDTAYSETHITIAVNNSGNLIQMEYAINGASNCVFGENNSQNENKAQFNFKNSYKYEFKY